MEQLGLGFFTSRSGMWRLGVGSLVICLLLLVVVSGSLAQISPSFAIRWYSTAGGSELIANPNFALSSTVGEGSNGLAMSGDMALAGGYVTGETLPPVYRTYLPIVMKP